jgi:Uma2 family endonuclease
MITAQAPARPAPPTDRLVTAKEFAEHPEWGPCELVRGKVVAMTNPKPKHGFLANEIAFHISRYAREKQLGPDVGFVRTERLPPKAAQDEYFETAPDLCVEVVSPTDRWSEISEKVDLFLGIGVRLVWVVDPQTRKAHVYRKGREVKVVDAKGSLDGEDVLPGFALPLADVFSAVE